MSAARSGIGWLVAKLVGLGASWFAAAYFARALTDPQATLGQFYLFETIVSLSMLAISAGTGGAITQRLSSTMDQRTRNRYLGAGIVVLAVRFGVVVVVMLAALPLYERLFDRGILVGVFVIILVFALQIKTVGGSVLSGQSRVGRSGAVGLVDTAVQAFAQALFVFLGAGLIGLIGGAVVGSVVASVFGLIVVKRSIGIARPRGEEIRSVLRYTKDSFMSGVATKFYDNVDILAIRYFLDERAVGVYGIGFRFALPVQIASGAISDAMLPEVSKEVAGGNEERVTELISDALVYATIIALPATVGGAILARPLVVTAFTGAFVDSALIAVVGIAIQIPAGFRSVFTSALNAADRPDVPARAGFILIVVNLVLDLLLIPVVGAFGAILASFVAISLVTIYLGYHVFSIFELTLPDLPLREFGAEVAASLLMGGVVYGLREGLGLPNIPLLAVAIPTGAIVYFSTLVGVSGGIRRRLLGIASDVLPFDLSADK